ncbi:hypothetical protein ACSLBF_10425 [Pseudoalteromonas sp. T1lg65]|uniref:hypothetical protein n=1 Tax=Pseudoalteromonas sp. T1lg65 TaxID=2077101 RepID=UPI003F7B16F1
MFSILYFVLLIVLTVNLLIAAFKLRGGPKDYVPEDSIQANDLGAKAYTLLRQRNNIDTMNDQYSRYVALVDWKDEAKAFNTRCESHVSQSKVANLIELPNKTK